jgi:hypothetical protein
MNPFAEAIFAAENPCVCCNQPAECACALLIPPFGSPYADYATAATAITDQTDGCVAFYEASTLGSLSASFDGTTLIMDGVDAAMGPGASLNFWASVSLLAGETLSTAYAVTTDGTLSVDPIITLYRCDAATVVDTDTDAATSGTLTVTADVDGEYYILIQSAATGATNFSMDNSVTSSGAFTVNPVIALWDDSGTTRNLWACPKFILPTVTEPAGTWYADCTSAASVITDDTQSCLAYYKPDIGTWGSKSASGGSSLSMDGTLSGTSPNEGGTAEMYGGIFGIGGDTLDLDYSVTTDDSTGTLVTVNVYDAETLAILFTDTDSGSGTVSGTFNYALPNTGRFIVRIVSGPTDEDSTSNAVSLDVSSSGTMAALEIQARYDLGLTCPATLNCGDSC